MLRSEVACAKLIFKLFREKKKKMVCPHSAKTEQVCGRPTSGELGAAGQVTDDHTILSFNFSDGLKF